VHQNPRPSIEALNRFYEQSKYHVNPIPEDWQSRAGFTRFAHWYYDEKIQYALQHAGLLTGSVFDIGFGHGGALRVLADRGWRTRGFEPDARLFDFAARTAELTGIQEGLLGSDTDIEPKVDLVFSNHTFEHIVDLHGAMTGITHILRPGGFIFTAIPTYYSNRSRLSLEWMNSAHYSMFTHMSLNNLFARFGLEEVAHTYRGWRKEVDDFWHVARLNGKVVNPEQFYEDPCAVRHYIEVVNPRNSVVHTPQMVTRQAGMKVVVLGVNVVRRLPKPLAAPLYAGKTGAAHLAQRLKDARAR
jgi:SAM-dependent methyltransferase